MSWATTDTLPERQHGPGWSTSVPSSARRSGPGWFTLLEKVAPFAGDGSLAAALKPRYAITVAFTGSGVLTTALALRNSRTVDLSGQGDLAGLVYQIVTRTALLSGSGQYDAGINDGLSAIIQTGLAARFSGGGSLLVDTEGGEPPADGLTASLVGRYLIPAYFDSVGQLIGNLGEVKQSLADLGGTGTLTADTSQIYTLLGELVSSGALSAVAFRNTFDVLGPLLGSGALSATEFAKYLTSVGFTGAGAFTALLLQIYNAISGAGGVGTMTALIMQRYYMGGVPVLREDFDLPDSLLSPGPNWTPRYQKVGITGGAAYGVSQAWNTASHNTPMTGDDMEVAVVMGAKILTGGDNTFLPIGANEAGQSALGYFVNGTAAYIHTTTSWSLASLVQRVAVSVTWGTGDRMSIRRVGNTYTLRKNGVLIPGGTWVDTADLIPRDSSHRLVGLDCYRNSASYRAIDSWEATDLNAVSLLSGNSTLTALTSQIYSPTPAFAGDGTLTALAIAAGSGSAAFSGNGTLSATVAPICTSSAALTGDGTLAATGVRLHPMSAIFTGSGTLTATGTAVYISSAALTGDGTLAATGVRLHPMSAALSGGGALSATVSQIYSFAAVFTGSGTLTATGAPLLLAALSGSGTLTATAVRLHPMTAAPSGAGVLTATGTEQYAIAAGFGDT